MTNNQNQMLNRLTNRIEMSDNPAREPNENVDVLLEH